MELRFASTTEVIRRRARSGQGWGTQRERCELYLNYEERYQWHRQRTRASFHGKTATPKQDSMQMLGE